ncbi:unnamed protein product, partial [marine sediment metagenome]
IDNPVSVAMASNMGITAVFGLIPPVQYTLDIAVSGEGTTNPAPWVIFIR